MNKLKILVISGSSSDAIYFENTISKTLPETEVYIAVDKSESVKLAKLKEPDVIVIDVPLFVEDSLEISRIIKEDEALNPTPILFVTDLQVDRKLRDEAIKAGAEAFLLKPIDDAILITQLTAMAKIKERNILISRQKEKLTALVESRTYELKNETIDRKRLRSILETTQDGFLTVGENGKLIDVNEAYCKMTGYSRDEILNLTISDLVFFTSPEEDKRREERILTTKHDLYETKHVKKNGDVFYVEISASCLAQEPLELICFCRDITPKKNDEQKIIEMNERLRNIIEATNAGTLEINVETGEVVINKKYAEMLGYALGEISPLGFKAWTKLVHHKDLSIVEKEIEKLTNKETEHFDIELRIRHKNGRWIWINFRAKITKWEEDGKATLISGMLTDITDRKKAEEEIYENMIEKEAILKEAQYMAQLGRWDFYHDENRLQWTETIFDIFEIDSEYFGASYNVFLAAIHPDDRTAVDEAWKSSLVNKKPYNIEYRLLMGDGRIKWVYGQCRTEFREVGYPVHSIGIVQDITQRKEVENLLFNEREQIKTTLISVGDGVISTDSKGKIVILNPIAEKLTGWSQEEAYNEPLEKVLNIINEDTREPRVNPAENLKFGKTIEIAINTILINKNGEEISVEESAAPIKDKDGNIVGSVIVFRDFTQKREKQKQIEYLSFHDHLTGLYNRRYMEDSIRRLDTNRNLPLSIIVSDVNGLKLTNDAYGHGMGDELLRVVSEILKNSCRQEDIICRVGGDEFTILLPNTNEEEIKKILERITEESRKTKLDSVIVSLAVGYSTKNSEEKNIFDVYKEADNKMYKNKLKYGRVMRNKTIETVILNINNKYDNEKLHTKRVSLYCRSIASAMKLSNKEIKDAKMAGALHDIGKIIVPQEILNKENELTQEESKIINDHPVIGYQILKSVDEYSHLAEAVLYHHERLDRSGYPERLKKDEIPLLSRIISVADAFEAMTSKRLYKRAKTTEEAIEELKKGSGTQFDEEIVNIFINQVL